MFLDYVNYTCFISDLFALVLQPIVAVFTCPVDPNSLIEATYVDIVCIVKNNNSIILNVAGIILNCTYSNSIIVI